MSYEVKTAYIDITNIGLYDYLPKNTVEFYMKKYANKGIELFNLEPSDWIWGTYTHYCDVEGTRKKITYENTIIGRKGILKLGILSLMFYIKPYLPEYEKYNSGDSTGIELIYHSSISNKDYSLMKLNGDEWTGESIIINESGGGYFKSVIEYIQDIGGGIHYSVVRNSGDRVRTISFVPYYHLETNAFCGWSIVLSKFDSDKNFINLGEQSEALTYFWPKRADRMIAYNFIQTHTPENKIMFSTKSICNKYYSIGCGECITKDPKTSMYTYNYISNSNTYLKLIQNKIKIPYFYESKDLYLVNTNHCTIAYTKDEEEE